MSNRDDDFNFDDDFDFDADNELRDGLGDDDFAFEDEDDLFGDDDAGGFGFDDEDDFGGGFDDDGDLFADDSLDGLDEYDDDFLIDEESANEGEGGGPNRTFVILAGIMIVFFILGLGLVLFLALGDDGPSEFDITFSARETENAEALVALESTQTAAPLTEEARGTESAEQGTQQAVDATSTAEADSMMQTETAVALNAQETQTAQTATQAVVSITETFEADQNASAANATQDALQLTQAFETRQAADAGNDDPPEETPVPPDADTVALTATAIAGLLTGPTPTAENLGEGVGGGADATAPPSTSGGGVTGTPQTALPDTGLFDDFGGSNNMALLALVAVGLVGVIFGARRLRSTTNDTA